MVSLKNRRFETKKKMYRNFGIDQRPPRLTLRQMLAQPLGPTNPYEINPHTFLDYQSAAQEADLKFIVIALIRKKPISEVKKMTPHDLDLAVAQYNQYFPPESWRKEAPTPPQDWFQKFVEEGGLHHNCDFNNPQVLPTLDLVLEFNKMNGFTVV